MTRVILAIAAAATVSGCAFFQRDQCTSDARADLRAIDAEIAQAREEAKGSFAARLSKNGDTAPFICRKNGSAMVECTSLPAPEGGKLAHDWDAHYPKARLARLDRDRQRILLRMKRCQSA